MENNLKKELIEEVVDQIWNDVLNGTLEPLEELLNFCPVENLIGYLPEELGKKFQNG